MTSIVIVLLILILLAILINLVPTKSESHTGLTEAQKLIIFVV
jgi:hypothetical protein